MSYTAAAERARRALQVKGASTTLRRTTVVTDGAGQVTGSTEATWPVYAMMAPLPSRSLPDRTVVRGMFYLSLPMGSTCVPQQGDELFYLGKWWGLPLTPTPLAPDGETVVLYTCEVEI